ncbi:hypothetical protein RvY_17368 [Ramazzottius varieornatus]|uniref:Arf-GAP domain-containing protein n=1 Tax=Ramazzottius varieornatus TaxID=947166 RepID=A0A1D1W7S8_RAMVA|nr:hypothetical protein RvY_17368 [Ramazzottius varieornatus]
MSDDNPSKSDVAAVLKLLRGKPSNKTCFDCGQKNPTWASVTYGVFLCIDCSAVHRSLGVHLTFIRSTQLDTNWSWMQLRAMQLGGNAHATEFFRSHGCTSTDAQQKYNSRAAQLYREKLQQMAIQAMKIHGAKLHLDTHSHEEHTEETSTKDKKDHVDFFEAHSENSAPSSNWTQDKTENGSSNEMRRPKNGSNSALLDTEGPSVDSKLYEASSSDSNLVGKHTLASRKHGSGAGGQKKSGKIGAQKVDVNFEEFEKQAEESEKRRLDALANRAVFDVAPSPNDDKTKMSSRLTYQDQEVDRKKEEERIKKSDPKKAEQLERLGMGIGARGKISHSIMSDMTKIEQSGNRPGNNRGGSDPPSTRSYGAVDRQPVDEEEDDGYSCSSKSKPLKSAYAYSREEPSKTDYDDASWDMGNMKISDKKKSYDEDSYQSPSNNKNQSYSKKTEISASSGDDAQKKFGNAKSISSDMYFGNSSSASDWETKSNLNRFEGKNSISSADYFGTSDSSSSNRGGATSGYSNMNVQPPDLSELKESVRQGVTKVAGRLSSMASNVMSNLQDRYG